MFRSAFATTNQSTNTAWNCLVCLFHSFSRDLERFRSPFKTHSRTAVATAPVISGAQRCLNRARFSTNVEGKHSAKSCHLLLPGKNPSNTLSVVPREEVPIFSYCAYWKQAVAKKFSSAAWTLWVTYVNSQQPVKADN